MVFLITTASLRHRSRWHLTVRRHSALLADSCQLTANSLQLTADSFYLLTAFPTTVIDSSLALRMTPFVLRHYDAFRSPLLVTCFPQSSFWTVARMPCGKDGKRDSDTEWRICYPDSVLPSSSLRQQILHIRSGWRLTFPSLWCLAVSGTFISKQESLSAYGWRKTASGGWKKDFYSIFLCHSFKPVSSSYCINDERCFMRRRLI